MRSLGSPLRRSPLSGSSSALSLSYSSSNADNRPVRTSDENEKRKEEECQKKAERRTTPKRLLTTLPRFPASNCVRSKVPSMTKIDCIKIIDSDSGQSISLLKLQNCTVAAKKLTKWLPLTAVLIAPVHPSTCNTRERSCQDS